MKRLVESTIRKENVTEKWLLDNHFCYNRIYSNGDSVAYTYRFPVYKYGCCITLDGEIVIFLDNKGEVKLNVYDANTRNKYAPFYYNEYGNFSVILDVITSNFKKQLKKFDIKIME